MPILRIAAALSVAVAFSTSAVAQGDTTCARDLLVAQSMQRQALDQLEQADGDEAKNCRVWRRHVETMRRVASVYGRCLSGSERSERLAQVQGSDREFSAAIKARCKG
ncbi:hypothetical protein SAMN02799622_03680 [Methylobacterium sp. UNC378MF]|uniref:hypothetical protein n=1 Tax=Methylobacterium sp. UNC378MF TaxID=1502748 RepID=UPI000881796E|nr:hypothetical protein [Methylobacterium sp. UNC378MF]SDA25820.1 hypothetical protein SAMN02799622_03680 [Methylobacterium sp. UNC378MF]